MFLSFSDRKESRCFNFQPLKAHSCGTVVSLADAIVLTTALGSVRDTQQQSAEWLREYVAYGSTLHAPVF